MRALAFDMPEISSAADAAHGHSHAHDHAHDHAHPLDEACAHDLAAHEGLNDATAAYVVAMQAPFEQLRQAAAQLAGILVLAASGSRRWAGHPMLPVAEEARKAAEDAIRSARVPARAAHHHTHLVAATRALAHAETRLRDGLIRRADDTIDAALAAVQAAYDELQKSTRALPGFEMIDLSQSCCAVHAAPSRPGDTRALG